LLLCSAWIAQAVGQGIEVLPADFRGAVQPQVVAAPGGDIFLTFGRADAVFCAASTNGGRSFLRPVEVGRLPKLALGMRRGPRIAATDRQVTISAISHEDGNLYSWTSENAGVTWSAPVTVNSAARSAREGLHGMAGDGRGNVFTAWLDLRNKGTQLWGAASRDGGKTWGPNVMIYQSPEGHICECCHPSVDMPSPGAIRVMWRNWLDGARDMYAALSADGGRTFVAAQKLGAGTWPLNGCPMDGGALAGRYAVWRRGNSVYFTDDHPGEHLLGEGRQPVVALGPAGPCFVWQEGSRLMWNLGTLVKPAVLAEGASFPSIVGRTRGGGPIVCWESLTNGVPTIMAALLD
jgi:hypothetical protein